MVVEWDRRRRAEGRVALIAWVVLALIVVLVGGVVWLATRPKTYPLSTDLAVYANDAERCDSFEFRRVLVQDEEGQVLWRGDTGQANPHLRSPTGLGCEFWVITDGVPERDNYVITIDGVGTHTFRRSVLEENFDIAEWDDICIDDSAHCDLPQSKGNFTQ